MKPFMDEDFLLSTPTAKKLYHEYAEPMPVLDYHCHINAREIAEDRVFDNITQVWLGGDHYKWRLMRSDGVEEKYITGDAPDREKFQKWAETLGRAIGNPLYHWSHLELKRYFGYNGILNGSTAEEVWNLCNEKLRDPSMSARNLIRQSRVTLLCTTDDPADDLQWHQILRDDDTFDTQVLPAWRPDKAMKPDKPGYSEYIMKLSSVSGINITSFADLTEALKVRLDFFDSMGCRTSDHGLDYAMYAPASDAETEKIFEQALTGSPVSSADADRFRTALLLFLAPEYAKRGWVMQIHFGCRRDNNSPAYEKLGPDTGFDTINDYGRISAIADYMDALNKTGGLPRIILYSLNPTDNALIGSLIGCFQDSSARGKIQQGSAWWFNDHKKGMTEQMTTLASLGMLANFPGMLTDSRSFLSYTRHEYFRRILCDLAGRWVENGEYPADFDTLGKIIKGISYNNAIDYFKFHISKED